MNTTLPSLTQTATNLRANKAFGQNFLLDQGLCDDIAPAVTSSAAVLEIGPGPGGLTRALLCHGKNVTAVDFDRRMIGALRPLAAAHPERLRLLHANALELRLDDFAEPIALVGNLPFNIATKLLLLWLPQSQHIAEMVLMFQAEVAERLTAVPNTKPYGRLAVLTQYLMQIEVYCDIPAVAFTPPPRVNATVLRFTPRADITARLALYRDLDHVLKMAFAARRKTLGVGLKGKIPNHTEVLNTAAIDTTRRAESLNEADFLRLAHAMLESRA